MTYWRYYILNWSLVLPGTTWTLFSDLLWTGLRLWERSGTQKENSSTIKSHAVSLDGDMLPVRQSQTGPSFKNLDTQLECERFLLSKSFFVAVRRVYSLPNKPFQDCILWTFAVPIQGTEPVWRGTRSIQWLSWLPISSDVAGVVTCFVTHAIIMR